MKQFYKDFNFRAETLELIHTMNDIIVDYMQQGYTLTVRQLYYQLVARAIVENTERSYKRITGVVNDARLAGMMDWSAIEDRTRDFIRRNRWDSPQELIYACAKQFHMDMWSNQTYRVFCIVEKEALAGVLERVCRQYDVPLLAARGYPSGTVLREFAVDDLLPAFEDGKEIRILHLGDHDPSGLDMTRDLTERLEMFCDGNRVDLVRIALNMQQIQSQKPPPNPAKTTDARFAGYMREYGDESWELDALQPSFLTKLVERNIKDVIDRDEWEERIEEIESHKVKLNTIAENYDNDA